MIHTVHIDDIPVAGKRFITEFNRVHKGIEFDNPSIIDKIPEGSVSSEEFRRGVKEGLKKKLIKNGYLQETS
jgi:hypothetical protein